jgi:hypothetical protein
MGIGTPLGSGFRTYGLSVIRPWLQFNKFYSNIIKQITINLKTKGLIYDEKDLRIPLFPRLGILQFYNTYEF